VVIILENLMTEQDEGLIMAKEIFSLLFMIFPPYNIGMAVFRLIFLSTVHQIGTIYLGRPVGGNSFDYCGCYLRRFRADRTVATRRAAPNSQTAGVGLHGKILLCPVRLLHHLYSRPPTD